MSGLSISHYLCPPGYSLEAFLDQATEVGAGAVALSVRAIDEVGVIALRKMVTDRGLAVSSLNSAGYFTAPDGPQWKAQSKLNEALVEAAAVLEAGVLCVITGGLAAAQFDLTVARSRIEERLKALVTRAESVGAVLGIEPIHPAEITFKGCINTIENARAFVNNKRSVKVIIDNYHSWWDPMLEHTLASHLADVALVQICNIYMQADGLKFCRGALPDPGLGGMSLSQRANGHGYCGWHEFEIFPADLRGRTVEAVMKDAASVFRRLSTAE